MPEVHRRRVAALADLVEHDDTRPEAGEAIRALVGRVALTPELHPGRRRATPTVDREAAPAAILHLASSAKTGSNSKKPASGEEAGLEEAKPKLVAGA